MKTKRQTLAIVLTTLLMFMLTAITTQSQIQFQGLASENEGTAGWDADGTGPEPAATGHAIPLAGFPNQPYYGSSRDYVNTTPHAAGFHFQDVISGFPLFAQALTDNGFSAEQVKVKFGLGSLEDDIEGVDWLITGVMYYANYYNFEYLFELDGEPMISGVIGYINMSIPTAGGDYWVVENSFTKPADASGSSSTAIQEVANAFLQDLAGEEMHITYHLTSAGLFNNNGRDGGYYNVKDGIIEKGLPTIPFQGLAADHEGMAFWDTDGTGPEPLREGHLNYPYFCASRDYDDIDTDPDAAFSHFLSTSEGFTNFYLQIDYRGYTPGQIKVKSGIGDLGEDIEGEDWFGPDSLNYYHSLMTVELDGEPVIGFMVDTINAVGENEYNLKTSPAIVYDASENSSADIQFIAQAFLKDLEKRQVQMQYIITDTEVFSGINGRSGYFFQIDNGNLTAKQSNCTRVYEGNVSGTWMASCSPYIIEGDLTVPNGETLTIEPGVWVKFMDRYPINVQGSVVAEGDNTNTGGIVFTAVNPDKGWGGFDIVESVATESISFDNCIFEYGSAYGENLLNAGGAIAIANFDNVTIDNCIFRYNKAIFQMGGYYPCAGAIGLYNSSPVIRNSVFFNNYTTYIGGAIMCLTGSNPDISRCLFHNNTADEDGGAIEIWNSNPTLINNTFSLNHAEHWGGAINVYLESNPDFVNCIFFDNTASQGKQISVSSNDCILDIKYCDISGGEAGIGPYGIGATGTYENNIDEDPAFASELAFDYHLSNASPCVNTGDPSIFDPDGTISDMGALYFSIPEPPVALDPMNITNISFTAVWEVNYEVLGYILDVATDAGFTEIVPGYDSLDVGFVLFHQVTVPEQGMPYYYRVRAYNAAGLSESSNSILVLLTGMEENMSENLSGLSIVPNPVNNNGNITFTLKDASGVHVEIFNYTGQKVLSIKPEKQHEGQVSIPVNFNMLPSGSYVCRITTDKSIHTTKFIKY